MWDYTDKAREYFLNPKGVGEIKDPSGVGEVGSLACGDALKLYLKIDDAGIIEDAKFQTFGCASAIASSSALIEMVIGKHVDEAIKVTNKDIASFLGGLPREKMHCSVMGQEALEAAIRDYKGEPQRVHCHEGELVCKCFGITDVQIRKAVQENSLKTVEDVTSFTKAGGGCGDCFDAIQKIIDEEIENPTAPKPVHQEFNLKPKLALTNVQRMQKVIQVIDDVIKPALALEGRDVELIDVAGAKVVIKLHGKMSECRTRSVTAHDFIENTLKDHVESDIVVEEV